MCAAVDSGAAGGGFPTDSSGDTLPAAAVPTTGHRTSRVHTSAASADATSPAGDAGSDSASGPTIGGGYHAPVNLCASGFRRP